jgi:hypothetical protein
VSVGAIQLTQRYELAAALCVGKRVLDVGEAPDHVRGPLASSAAELAVWDGDSAPMDSFDAVIRLAGRRGLPEIERLRGDGVAVLVAFERSGSGRRSPRAEPPAEDAARALAQRLPGAVQLPQYVMEGSLIGEPGGRPELDLRGGGVRDEDAVAVIVASGFDPRELQGARTSLKIAAAPVLLSYLRGLESAHADLLRANRELMRERLGRDGSAAASLLNAQRELEEMKEIARGHEEQVRRVHAWYDAPRYHLVDRTRDTMTKIPGLPGFIRFLWSLISTRAETPALDAAANPEPDEGAEEVTKEREGMSKDERAEEPQELSSRLES